MHNSVGAENEHYYNICLDIMYGTQAVVSDEIVNITTRDESLDGRINEAQREVNLNKINPKERTSEKEGR